MLSFVPTFARYKEVTSPGNTICRTCHVTPLQIRRHDSFWLTSSLSTEYSGETNRLSESADGERKRKVGGGEEGEREHDMKKKKRVDFTKKNLCK